MSGITVWVFGLLAYVYFKDDPAPQDDSDLLPSFASARDEDNPLATFCREMKSHDLSDWDNLSDEAKEWNVGQEAVLQAYLDKHVVELGLFEDLMRTNPKQWAWRGVDSTISWRIEISELKVCSLTARQLEKTRIILLERAGKHTESLEAALQLMRFGSGLGELDGALTHHIVATNILKTGLQLLKTALLNTTNEDLVRRAQEVLGSRDLSSQSLAQALRVEYLSCKNSGALFEHVIMSNGGMGSFERAVVTFTTLPNRTLTEHRVRTRRLIEALELDWAPACQVSAEISEEVYPQDSSKWDMLLKPNAGGRILLMYDVSRLQSIFRSCAAAALHRMSVLNLALRRHELARGRVPDTLEELAPDFLPSVPMDPFDGKPLRWDPNKKWVYSVGDDLVDDLGKHDEPEMIHGWNPDLVMLYWWRPAEVVKPASAFPKPMRRRIPTKAP